MFLLFLQRLLLLPFLLPHILRYTVHRRALGILFTFRGASRTGLATLPAYLPPSLPSVNGRRGVTRQAGQVLLPQIRDLVSGRNILCGASRASEALRQPGSGAGGSKGV